MGAVLTREARAIAKSRSLDLAVFFVSLEELIKAKLDSRGVTVTFIKTANTFLGKRTLKGA